MSDLRDVHQKLDEMDAKLDETISGLQSGPVKDAMRLVVPMMKDQMAIIRMLVKTLQSK